MLAKILKNFKNLKIDKAINWNKIINMTEGYSFGDMKALFDRAVFFAIKACEFDLFYSSLSI